jgi:hypothetical protein
LKSGQQKRATLESPFLFANFVYIRSEEVFAQCNGLAIHAPVKSPDTGRTEGILIEVVSYVVTDNDEIYVLES